MKVLDEVSNLPVLLTTPAQDELGKDDLKVFVVPFRVLGLIFELGSFKVDSIELIDKGFVGPGGGKQ